LNRKCHDRSHLGCHATIRCIRGMPRTMALSLSPASSTRRWETSSIVAWGCVIRSQEAKMIGRPQLTPGSLIRANKSSQRKRSRTKLPTTPLQMLGVLTIQSVLSHERSTLEGRQMVDVWTKVPDHTLRTSLVLHVHAAPRQVARSSEATKSSVSTNAGT